jgi:hypothetical protein
MGMGMAGIARHGACVGLIAMAWIGGVVAVEAAGALAIGSCGAYGQSYDYPNVEAARGRALAECVGRECRIVATMQHACAAFSIDGGKPCGAFGWAMRLRLAMAQNVALRECYAHGGRNCVIRAFVCDGRG